MNLLVKRVHLLKDIFPELVEIKPVPEYVRHHIVVSCPKRIWILDADAYFDFVSMEAK